MAGISKSRSALYADILAIITNGGELTAAELSEILDNHIASMASLEDDIVPGVHSDGRAYSIGDITTKDERVLVCGTAIPAKAFDAADWHDVEETKALLITELDITTGGTIDLATVANKRMIRLTCDGAAQTITDFQNAINGFLYKFVSATGKTITFGHTAIAGNNGGKFSNKGGAGLAIVGRAGEASDHVEYKYDGSGDFFVERDSAVYV
jgi:hypothetical protein